MNIHQPSLCARITAFGLGTLVIVISATLTDAATVTVSGGGQGAIVNALRNAKPGDIILVAPGNYDDNITNERLTITTSGTAAAPITLKSSEKHKAKIGNVTFDNASYVIVDGFEITPISQYNTSYGSVNIEGGRNITVRNMHIHHVRVGVQVLEGTDHTIENSLIHDNVLPGSGTNEAHGILVHYAKNTTIRGNTLYGAVADSIQLYKPESEPSLNRGTTRIENNTMSNTRGYCSENAVDIKGELGTVLIKGNVMHGYRMADPNNASGKNAGGCQYVPSGSSIGVAINAHDGSTGQLRIEQNRFHNTESAVVSTDMTTVFQNNILHDFVEQKPLWGLSGSLYTGAVRLNSKMTVYHNTFVNIPWLTDTVGGSGTGATIANNLFYNVKQTPANNTYSNNAWFGTSQRQTGSGDVTTGTLGLNMTTYALEAGSALIDKGKNVNVTLDFSGATRPSGSAPDIGADEFTNGSGGTTNSGGGTTTPPTTPGAPSDCHGIVSPQIVATGYGVPYDTLTGALLMTARCAGTAVDLAIGDTRTTTYAWKKGYWWSGSGWQPYTLQCAEQEADGWCIGSGKTTIQKITGSQWVVGYTCVWSGSIWRCGCRTSTCGTTESSWQLQTVQ